MQSSDFHYIMRETVISVFINTALSCGFFYLQFHSLASVPWNGHDGLLLDSLPQTFAVALMSVLVPTLITRRRRAKDALPIMVTPRHIVPSNALIRAAGMAVVTTLCGFAATYVVAGDRSLSISFRYALAFKCGYGAFIALIVTPFAVWMALHDAASGKADNSLKAKVPH